MSLCPNRAVMEVSGLIGDRNSEQQNPGVDISLIRIFGLVECFGTMDALLIAAITFPTWKPANGNAKADIQNRNEQVGDILN